MDMMNRLCVKSDSVTLWRYQRARSWQMSLENQKKIKEADVVARKKEERVNQKESKIKDLLRPSVPASLC